MSIRIKVKGHYRKIVRDEKGRFISCEKWHSKPPNTLEAKTELKESEKEK